MGGRSLESTRVTLARRSHWNTQLGIQWPLVAPSFLSEKDKSLPAFAKAAPQFEHYRSL